MAHEPDTTLFRRQPQNETAADPPPASVRMSLPETPVCQAVPSVAPPPEAPRPELPRQPAPEPKAAGGADDELLTILRRMEGALQALRGQLETSGREQRYREFSPARLIGALLQALVVGFVIAALADWIYAQPVPQQVVKVGLAGVLQLGALTAFLLARGK